MKPPYIEISQRNSSEWQAIIAWHINIPSHKDWLPSKWGFNAGALLDEALDRLKLFIKSFHTIDIYNQAEPQYPRTLALRCINIPGEGLQLGLVGKIFSPSQSEALSTAAIFSREIESIFPQDFLIFRATTKNLFLQITGESIFDTNNDLTNVLHIKRADIIAGDLNIPNFFTSFWQATSRSSEQIWRALAATPHPVLLNITLCSTLIFENELSSLWEVKNKIENINNDQKQFNFFNLLLPWYKNYISRRVSPWNKYYYLQVHIVTKGKSDESLARNIGSAITHNSNELTPGFLIEDPESAQEKQTWLDHLHQIDIIPSTIRLHSIADLEEAYTVFRCPYLSETGLPNVKFVIRSMD